MTTSFQRALQGKIHFKLKENKKERDEAELIKYIKKETEKERLKSAVLIKVYDALEKCLIFHKITRCMEYDDYVTEEATLRVLRETYGENDY